MINHDDDFVGFRSLHAQGILWHWTIREKESEHKETSS